MLEFQEIREYILQPLLDAGYQAYVCGGYVRDVFLNRPPRDIDIATNAKPNQVHKIFTKVQPDDQKAVKFGTSKVIIKDEPVDITTFKERPCISTTCVHYTDDIKKDAASRDFTINAVYMDINGQLIDPLNRGLNDLSNKRLCFCSKKVFLLSDKEDVLRSRFFKFLSQGFCIPDESYLYPIKSFINPFSKRALKNIKQMLASNCSAEILSIFKQFNGFQSLDVDLGKQVLRMESCMQDPKWHSEGDVWTHTLLVADEMAKRPHDHIDMLAAIFHDCGKPKAAKVNPKKANGHNLFKGHDTFGADILRNCSLRILTNKELEILVHLVENHMFVHEIKDTKSKLEKWKILQLPHIERLIKLADCDSIGCIPADPENKPVLLSEYITENDLWWMTTTPLPEAILTKEYVESKQIKGEDRINKMLNTAYKLQIDQNITNINTLYKRVKSIKA